MKHHYFSLSTVFSSAKKTNLYVLLLAITFALLGNSAQAQVAGPNDTSNGTTSGGAGTAWNFPNRIQADDTNYSTCALGSNANSEYLRGTNYGFAIPAGATINGIVLRIMRQSSSTGGGNSVNDVSVRLMKGGVAVGNNYANGADWPNTMTGINYGSATDLWGTTWTAAEINAGNFGAQLMVESENSSRTASVDFMQITVYYTSAPTITGFNPNNVCSGTTPNVVITGTNFTGATAVRFNGTTAAFTVNSSTQITATLPAGATTGPISVTTPNGTANSATNFTVNSSPVVAAITGTLTLCPAATTLLSNATPGGIWSSGSPSIATVDNAGLVTGVAAGNAVITYSVTSGGCTTNVTATVTVYSRPTLFGPTSVCIGDTIALSPNTGGTWVSNNPTIASIDSGTGVVTGIASGLATFTFTSSSNGCSNTTSSITVNAAAAVTAHPVPQSVCSGTAAVFSVTATGVGLTYQWYKGATLLTNGGSITGATSNTLMINAVTAGDAAADYHCIVSGTCSPSANSNNAALTVTEAVAISVQPAASQVVCANDTVQFSVVAQNAMGYQWHYNSGALIDGGTISGATSDTLTLTNVSAADAGNYYVLVLGNGPCANMPSAVASLVVDLPPVITAEPIATQTVCAETPVSFSVAATGGNLTYQWYNGSLPLTDSGSVSGSTSPSLHLSSPTLADSSADYHVVVRNSCTASATSVSAQLIVNERPYISNYTASVCSGAAFSVIPVNGLPGPGTIVPAGTTYSWSNPIVTGGITNGSAQTTQADISQVLFNPTNVDQTATYTVTPISGTAGNCAGTPFQVTVTVHPTPLIQNPPAQTACSGTTFSFTPVNGGLNIIPAGTTYSWGMPVILPAGSVSGATSGTNEASISQTLTNTSGVDGTATYTVTALSGSCNTTTFTVVFTVRPTPTVAGTPVTQTICSGNAITPILLSNPNSIPGAVSYSWSRDQLSVTGTIPASGFGSTISGTLVNSGNAPVTVTFTLVATSQYFCGSTPLTVSVVVNPLPNVQALPASQSICSGNAITPIIVSNPNNVSGTSFHWTRSNTTNLTGIADNGSGNISGTLVNNTNIPQTTTFTITPTANGCPGTPVNVNVTVNPKPTVALSGGSPEVCSGTAITPLTISNPNGVPGTILSWSATNPVGVSGPAAGTGNTISGVWTNTTNTNQIVSFSVVAASGSCSSVTSAQVVVKPTPMLSATNNLQSICQGGTMANIVLSTVNNLTGTTFAWVRDKQTEVTGIPNSGTTNTILGGSLTNTTSVAQTVTFTVTATAPSGNDCVSTATFSVTVYPVLTAAVISETQTVCAGSRPTPLVTSTLFSGGYGTPAYVWESAADSAGPWTAIPGATTSTYWPPTTNGSTPTRFYRLTVSNACGSVTSNTISVNVANNLNFAFSGSPTTVSVCGGESFTVNIQSGEFLADSRIRYTWAAADPTTLTPASGGPVGTTTFWPFPWLPIYASSEANITMTAVNNTSAAITTTFAITPKVYDTDTNAFICNLSPRVITVTIYPRPAATITAPAAGTTICSGTSAGLTLTGNLPGQMYYRISRTTNANVSSSATFVHQSPNMAGSASYVFNDLLTNTSASNQNVTYTITPYSADSSCPGTSVTLTVTVARPVTAGTIGNAHSVCQGGNPSALTQVTAATGTPVLTYQWYSGASATGPWLPIAGASSTTYDPPAGLMQSTWYIREVTSVVNGVSCSVATTTPVKVTVNWLNVGTLNGDQTICSGATPTGFAIVTPATAEGTLSYLWESSTVGCSGPWTTVGNVATYSPGTLTQTTYYRRRVRSTIGAQFCDSYNDCIVVTANQVTPGTIAGDQTLCGNIPAPFTELVPATGSSALSYQWQSNTVGCGSSAPWANIPGATSATLASPAISVTTYFRRIAYSTLNGLTCASAVSNCVTVTVNAVNAGAIGPNRIVCQGDAALPITFTTAATGTGLSYQWQSSSNAAGPYANITGAVSASYTPVSVMATTYYQCVVTGTVNGVDCPKTTNFVTVFVNYVTPPTISGTQSLCIGGDPSALTVSSPASGPGTISHQWQSSTTGSAPWTNVGTGLSYDPPAISQTLYYQVVATSNLSGQLCTMPSNIIMVSSLSKVWNGSLSTNWNTAANWTPVGVPTSANCVTVPNTSNKPQVAGSSYDAYAYSLTILGGGALDVLSGNSITVTDVVNVHATGGFTIENNANLVQINNVANIGNIHMVRTTQPMYRYDYTYWGSPVKMGSYTLGNLSPATQPDKYYSWNPTNGGGNGNWIQESAATIMNPVKGYIVRAPQTYSMNPMVTVPYTANFIGIPNNGDVNVPITVGSLAPGLFNDKMNLLGNPYPSAVDADLFLNHPANVPLMDGTVYFWTHHSPPSAAYVNPFYGNFSYNYTAGDYATYTSLGGTNTVPSGYGGPTPNGYIAAGQAFFVKGLASGNAVFTNAMRDKDNNSTFFRQGNAAAEKHRLWLNLANNQGGFSQALVGYAEGATTGYDRGLDGSSFAGNFVSFYSLASDNQTLTVQGRPLPFEIQDQVPMGYNATVANTYVIGIDHYDTFFDSQHIYLEDKLLNTIHDLKQSPYSFTTAAGNFTTRFVLRYTNATLAADQFDANQGLVAIIADEKLMVQASDFIESIHLYDMAGKLIVAYDPENVSKNFESPFHFAEGIYIVKVRLQNGNIFSRKLVNNR